MAVLISRMAPERAFASASILKASACACVLVAWAMPSASAIRLACSASAARLVLLKLVSASIAAAAYRMGRELPEAGEAEHVDWATAEWHLLRLVAVCALADEHGLV